METKLMKWTLQPWEVSWALEAGRQRSLADSGKAKNTADYKDESKLEDNTIANTAACLCELAVSLATRLSWNAPYWDLKYHSLASKVPDVGAFIEVRRTRNLGNGGVPVKRIEAEMNRFLVQAFVDPYKKPSEVYLIGWISAPWAWENGSQDYPEKRVYHGSLKPFFETEVRGIGRLIRFDNRDSHV